MQRFKLNRIEDETGISGTGVITLGYIYENGICVMKWLTDKSSVAVYACIEDVEAIHGHKGRTLVEIEEGEVDPHSVPSWVFDPIAYFEDALDVVP